MLNLDLVTPRRMCFYPQVEVNALSVPRLTTEA
jgi:hypothetical protein